MMKKITALLLVLLLLAGCSAAGDVETLLRAPQLSGESAALQKALNSYLGGSATLKYPASGDFLSPFAFGDWDGDGVDEAAVLYTADTTSSNVWLAVLEPSGESGWRVSQAIEGMSSEVESFSAASLKDADSKQLLTGYISPQGDQYLAVYQLRSGMEHYIVRGYAIQSRDYLIFLVSLRITAAYQHNRNRRARVLYQCTAR